jgi:hypothetical protein
MYDISFLLSNFEVSCEKNLSNADIYYGHISSQKKSTRCPKRAELERGNSILSKQEKIDRKLSSQFERTGKKKVLGQWSLLARRNCFSILIL